MKLLLSIVALGLLLGACTSKEPTSPIVSDRVLKCEQHISWWNAHQTSERVTYTGYTICDLRVTNDDPNCPCYEMDLSKYYIKKSETKLSPKEQTCYDKYLKGHESEDMDVFYPRFQKALACIEN